jgi:3-methyladenine DNA glycosylase AlkD
MPKRAKSTTPELATAAAVRRELRREIDPEKAVVLPRFFRTGPGEYGEGDRFLGVTVPKCRRVAKRARGMAATELTKLMRSPFHEERAVALFMLVEAFERADTERERERIHRFYRRNLKFVNNWDLVDGSAPVLVGKFLQSRDRSQLYVWARSKKLWERRIAMLATFPFIKAGDFGDAFAIARILRDDEHDLMHKAVGWMLREIGKRDSSAEERFLRAHYRKMPRTMLRYAIEKFPEAKRRAYLDGRAGPD